MLPLDRRAQAFEETLGLGLVSKRYHEYMSCHPMRQGQPTGMFDDFEDVRRDACAGEEMSR